MFKARICGWIIREKAMDSLIRTVIDGISLISRQMCRAFIHHILIYSEFTLMLRVVISPPSELMHHRVN